MKLNRIKKNRILLNNELRDIGVRKFFSPALLSGYDENIKFIKEYIRGKVIDLGCGDMPFKEVLNNITEYHSLDIEERVAGVTYVGDIQNMNMIQDNIYDSAICFEVLEHVQNPFLAVGEINRILKIGGTLVMSVPHLSRLHEEPDDFFRFTKYGLKFLLESSGFEVISIKSGGGIFSFLGHQFSSAFVLLFWHIPILKHIVFFLNKWLCVIPCCFLDRVVDKRKIFALGYICVAKKLK